MHHIAQGVGGTLIAENGLVLTTSGIGGMLSHMVATYDISIYGANWDSLSSLHSLVYFVLEEAMQSGHLLALPQSHKISFENLSLTLNLN